jgi:hypothetical protein
VGIATHPNFYGELKMQRLISLTIWLVFLAWSTVLGAHSTITGVDTVGYNSALSQYALVGVWRISATTTADTLTCPFAAKEVEVVYRGSTSTDTVWVSLPQSGYTASYPFILVNDIESLIIPSTYTNYRTATEHPAITRIIIDANATIPIWVIIKN